MHWIVVIVSLVSVVDLITIGKIGNYILIDRANTTFFNSTREQCICRMIQSTALISALDYFRVNQTCQLFAFNRSSVVLRSYANTSFVFHSKTSITITNLPSITCVNNTNRFFDNDEFIYSPTSQAYAAGMRNNQFGVYTAFGYGNVTSTSIWTALQTTTSITSRLALQADRNLVVYTSNNSTVLWSAYVQNGGNGSPFCLKMLDSGNLIWTDNNQSIIWQTNPPSNG